MKEVDRPSPQCLVSDTLEGCAIHDRNDYDDD
jgi:hypothetical protein